MSTPRATRPVGAIGALALLVTSLTLVLSPAQPAAAYVAAGSAYRVTNLASDIPGLALIQDFLMVDPWGIGVTAGSNLDVVRSGTSTTGLYRSGTGGTIVRHPTVPYINMPGGLPTGVVANPSLTGFKITAGTSTQPARFLWASITGNIIGWHENVPPGNKTGRVAASLPGHVYMGLAGGTNAGGARLYAADFANNHIDVFDPNFTATTVSGGFIDATIPAGYAPYNIQNIGGSLYVTYAKTSVHTYPETGSGMGYVRRFNTDGVRDLTFAINNGALNAPWGVAIAPASFGAYANALLVGNDAESGASIHAYNPTTGAYLGALQDDDGNPIEIDRLHALTFGNGGSGGAASTLYFTSGLGEHEHGLFGSIVPNGSMATSSVAFATDNLATSEGAGSVQISVLRSGDTSGSATVRYATWDQSRAGHGSQKNDYQINTGKLRFNPGQTSASFTILIGDDKFVEGTEAVDISLSNPTGTQLAGVTRMVLKINDNDVSPSSSNPIDGNGFFVTRQYLDFFNRVPDASGFAHWKAKLDACGFDGSCLKSTRVAVSAAFFTSSEFQNGMSLAYRSRKTSTGSAPLYGELMLDNQIRRGWGNTGLFDHEAANPEFIANTSSLTNTQFVDKMISNSGGTFSSSKRTAWITALNGATKTRTTVMGEVASDSSVQAVVFRPAFVFMQFAGYLRRDPDTAGYNYWLNRLNTYNGDYVAAGMVKNFVESSEYRHRFGDS